jgi:hypothetical protein
MLNVGRRKYLVMERVTLKPHLLLTRNFANVHKPKENKVMMTIFVFNGKHKVSVSHATALKKKNVHPVEFNPLVSFTYPSSDEPWVLKDRTLRLIAANNKYYIGLDIGDKNRFKKFRRDKARDFKILNFNDAALS